MKYKVINFHPNVKDVNPAQGAATQLESLINENSIDGWEYYRMEGMSVEVIPTGCGGSQPSQAKTSNIQLVVFRKNL